MEVIENTFNQIMQTALHDKSGWELTAVTLGLTYLILIIRQNIWAWLCAFISTAIYIKLFWHVSLFMESMLNVYYLIMAGYGYWTWSKNSRSLKTELNTIPIVRWSYKTHIIAISTVIAISMLSGFVLIHFTNAAWPFWDSITTWGSVLTTYMVAKKVLENWFYWLVIDTISIVLFVERGFLFTALLYVIYLILVIVGYIKWNKLFKLQYPASS